MNIRRNPYYKEAGDSFEILRGMFLDPLEKRPRASKPTIPVASPAENMLEGISYQRVNGDLKVKIPEGMTAEEAVVCLSAASTYFANESGLDPDEVFATFMTAMIDGVFKIVGKMIRDLRGTLTGSK